VCRFLAHPVYRHVNALGRSTYETIYRLVVTFINFSVNNIYAFTSWILCIAICKGHASKHSVWYSWTLLLASSVIRQTVMLLIPLYKVRWRLFVEFSSCVFANELLEQYYKTVLGWVEVTLAGDSTITLTDVNSDIKDVIEQDSVTVHYIHSSNSSMRHNCLNDNFMHRKSAKYFWMCTFTSDHIWHKIYKLTDNLKLHCQLTLY